MTPSVVGSGPSAAGSATRDTDLDRCDGKPFAPNALHFAAESRQRNAVAGDPVIGKVATQLALSVWCVQQSDGADSADTIGQSSVSPG